MRYSEGGGLRWNGCIGCEIVNDGVGGELVLISHCPLCGTGLVFSRVVDYQTLFTYSFNGLAVDGPPRDSRLTQVPSWSSYWSIWTFAFPEAELLEG
ncbi:MAG: DUF3179 domain-containing (seleno)protein [Candidatus Geothermarchaeales archaeon]